MSKSKSKLSSEKRTRIIGIVLMLLALLLVISLATSDYNDIARITGEIDSHLSPFEVEYHNQAGMLGAYLAFILSTLMGWLAYFLPLGLTLLSIKLLSPGAAEAIRLRATWLFVIALSSTMIYNVTQLAESSINVDTGTSGGFLAEKLAWLSLRFIGEIGSYVLLSGIVLILLVWHTPVIFLLPSKWRLPEMSLLRSATAGLSQLILTILTFGWLRYIIKKFLLLRKPKAPSTDSDFLEAEGANDESFKAESEQIDLLDDTRPDKSERKMTKLVRPAEQLQLKTVNYTYPTLDLLDENIATGEEVSSEELNATAEQLKETLESFGISIEGEISRFPGPVITRYEFKPGSGIKVSQINNLADDLALALKAKQIRLIAPIPGKAAVGVEIPNLHQQMVRLKEILLSPQFADPSKRLPLALGKTTSGTPYVTDLTKLPHVLVAGATGAGKSVCLNTIITSLIYRLHPHQIRFIMIDPKMLELTAYSDIPHLGRPVVTNAKRAEKVLADAVTEMESRYHRLASAGVRNIEDFNKKQQVADERIPYIVIMVDELADLMMAAASPKIETQITRLAQMARAVGIHLILATQRPSVDVITGLIKANFPSRIAFQVSTKVDSRTIIDGNGAERLLGLGDMLFMQAGQPEPIRVHGAYTSIEETERVVKFIKDQGLPMMALENISQATGDTTEADIDIGDPLFREACDIVVRYKQGSVSLLQRRLGIGYQRAARLIDKLEEAGVVSPYDGSKAREVLVDRAFVESLLSQKTHSPATTSEQN